MISECEMRAFVFLEIYPFLEKYNNELQDVEGFHKFNKKVAYYYK